MKSINPATNEIIKSYTPFSKAQVDSAISSAALAFSKHSTVPFKQKSAWLLNAARILQQDEKALAQLITQEMGKTIKEAEAEIQKCASACTYYAEHSEQLLKDENIETEAKKSFITYQPLGVILGVMPWNFPFWQVFRFAAPTLMAGNTILLKHASNVPGCALAIEEIFRHAGFPDRNFQALLIPAQAVEAVIQHPTIQAVTLTGSTEAGRSVARTAGQCLKKCVLELGGSDPYLILADADLELAAEKCVASRLINAGQSCIAAKRFIVEESVYQPFLQLFTEKMQAVTYGDPTQPENRIGPMASIRLRDELHQQVLTSVQQGAVCHLGGFIPEQNGAYYPPTVLTNLKPGMAAYDQELFGPVASVIAAKDEADAIAIANASVFGLGSAVFTRDLDKGEQIAKVQLQAGCAFVNDFVRSDPRLPFGGIKQSGYGRELSYFGIKEFTNIKTVYIR